MMKLIVEGKPELSDCFLKAFDIITKALLIADQNVTVHLKFFNKARESIYDFGIPLEAFKTGSEYTGGATEPEFFVDHLGRRHVAVYLNLTPDTEKFEPNRMTQVGYPSVSPLQVFCHEMTHVKQMATGQLRLEKGKPVWLGQIMTPSYENQPWEHDADASSKWIYPMVQYLEPAKYA